MIMRDASLVILGVIVIVMAISMLACTGYKYNDDNAAEEATELAIQSQSGIDLDLSPASPEKGFSPKSLKPFEKK